MTHDIDWSDPTARAALLERIGTDAYNAALEAHHVATTVARIGGHRIRTVSSPFGPLYAVGATGNAYAEFAQAAKFARENPVS